jgi:hypothetical protein
MCVKAVDRYTSRIRLRFRLGQSVNPVRVEDRTKKGGNMALLPPRKSNGLLCLAGLALRLFHRFHVDDGFGDVAQLLVRIRFFVQRDAVLIIFGRAFRIGCSAL